MDIPEISIDKAKELLEQGNSQFVDIRDPGSYMASHIENAHSISDGNVDEYVEKADKNQTHVIYCYHGNSSRGATAFFLDKGFKEVYSMTGGYAEWDQKVNQSNS